MEFKVEDSGAYLTEDEGMLDATRTDLPYAVVMVNAKNVSSLQALFRHEEDAKNYARRLNMGIGMGGR